MWQDDWKYPDEQCGVRFSGDIQGTPYHTTLQPTNQNQEFQIAAQTFLQYQDVTNKNQESE